MIRYPKLTTLLGVCAPLLGALLITALRAGSAEAGWSYAFPDPGSGDGSPLDSTYEKSLMPPGWMFDRMDPAGVMVPANPDPFVTFDPQIGHVRETYSTGGVESRPPLVADVDDYNNLISARTYRRLWRDDTRKSRSVSRTGPVKPKGLFHVDLPFQVPKFARGILGSGAPNLDVSGSETITLSGVSDWTVNRLQHEGPRQSTFPSLEMKQDLQVNLTGSIGDKIKVDVDQSSNVTTSLDNKVKLRYEGDEDDLIKSVDLGNTNLSLQGASIRQDGLFGIKTVAKLGNVDLVTIASKQEGKSESARFTPSGDKRTVQITDLNYIHKQYFLIADHPIMLKSGTLRVFKDDGNSSNNGSNPPDTLRLDASKDSSATNPQTTGFYDPLNVDEHYTIEDYFLITGQPAGQELKIPVIKMRYPMSSQDKLAVSYVEILPGGGEIQVGNTNTSASTGRLLKPLTPPDDTKPATVGGAWDKTDPWYPVINYELKDFYDLTARNIARETLDLKIRQRNNGQSVDPDNIDGKPLLQLTGLDQQGVTPTDPPDGRIDDRYVRADEGILFFPYFHPFNPRCQPVFPLCLDSLSNNPLADTLIGNPFVYDYKPSSVDYSNQSRFYIDASFKSSQQGYFIGRFNILENSEQVKVDNVLQQKGRDYTIDYETGQITFTNPPGANQTISVDYSFAPGAGQVQRTLMGFSSSYNPSADLSLSSSMLYESRGAQEVNPKLGEEPARSMVADLGSMFTVRPSWMTAFANLLPGVHTTAPSTMNFQGNVSVSMPNPNTKGEAYLDDMEGNRESNALVVSRLGWFWSSIPINPASGDSLSTLPDLLTNHALIQWYNPTSANGGAKEHDLKPVLTNEEGGDNDHQTLEMNMFSPDGTPSFPGRWTGLTQVVSRTGEDLSRTRYIEVWVNDRTPFHNVPAVLHLDFGRVSEDAYWNRAAPPNGILDTEDKNGDTKLDIGEDTGLDGVPDNPDPEHFPNSPVGEPGYDATTNPDPNGDDYHYDPKNAKDYSHVNGTEGNDTNDPNARPDTEDLDLNQRLDTDNAYFEASIDLQNPDSLVAVDVPRDYAGNPNVKPDNGWRLFRIPINRFKAFGRPGWDAVKHARLWVDGMTRDTTNLQIGGIELVGSRWLATPLDSSEVDRVAFEVTVRNNKDDVFYEPPFHVDRAVNGNATRKEQSLALTYSGLQNGDSLFAFKTFSDGGSGIGYTQYREIRFYVHGNAGVEAQSVRLVARFGADTVNYYEYSLPVRTGWQDVRIPMELLSLLKERSDSLVKYEDTPDGARYTSVGRPSFTRVNRIQFGLTRLAPGATDSTSGEVWVDELRLGDVRKDVGKTGNFTLQANFGDVLSVNANYQRQDQDFFRVGSGVNRGSGQNHTGAGLLSTLQLGRMVPLSSVDMPLRLNISHSADVPKYRTGSDVVLDKARSDLETSSADLQRLDFSYNRAGPRRGIMKWTTDAFSISNFSYEKQVVRSPLGIDSSWSFLAFGSYNLPIGGGKGLGLGKTFRVKYLPDLIRFDAGWTSTRRASYSRTISGLEDSTDLRSNVTSRLLSLGTRVSYLPFTGVTSNYSLLSTRDMQLRQDGFLGNVGTEIAHQQNMDLSWNGRRIFILNPSITFTGQYNEDAGPTIRINASDPLGLKNIRNAGGIRANMQLPLTRLTGRFSRSTPGDSSGTFPVLAPFRYLLGRLTDIQTAFQFDRSTTITRVLGDPGLSFKTGFTQKFDESVYRASNSNIIQSRTYTARANTTIQPVNRFRVDVSADHRLSYSDLIQGSRKTLTLTWPDLTGSWVQLQEALGMGDVMSSLIVSSHYSLRHDDQGPSGEPVEIRTLTTNWAPLLRWEAAFKNGVRADVNSSLQKTEFHDERLGGYVRLHSTASHDVRLSKVYPASKGIRFPWSKRPVRLPNDLNLNLTMQLSHDRQTNSRPGIEPIVDTDTKRLNVGSGTTYNFTPSITGGFDLGFRQTKDYKTDLTTRGITVAVNGQFRF